MPSILIIDDEPNLIASLVFALEGEGFTARGAASGLEGLAAAEAAAPDLVLLDLRLPDIDGMEALARLHRLYPGLPVVMISAHGDTRAAVKAVKAGAADYLTKPFELDDLFHAIHSLLARDRLAAELDFRRREDMPGDGLVGASPAMRALNDTLARIARSGATRILLLGESGTGKAVVAKAIHAASSRAGSAFIEVNCAALPEQLIEAELFGAEKGAYTGANQRRLGLAALADGGTLFLDEIGELPLPLQAKFLHFLESGEFRPIGGGQGRQVDVRVIAATNRNLADEVARGRFREDLFYRLNVIHLLLPPLRQRGDDVLRLAEHFAARYAREENCPPIHLGEEARRRFLAHGWPGNVRELKNLVERLTILNPGREIGGAELPLEMAATSGPAGHDAAAPLPDRLASTEQQLLAEALASAGGHKGRAAALLGISRHALKRRLQRLGLA